MSQSMFALALAWKVPVIALTCGLVIALYVSKVSLVLSLRSRQVDVWQQLGSPSPREIVFNPSGSIAKGLWSWVWSRNYRSIGDVQVSLAATCYRTAMIVFFPVAVVAIVVFASVGL